MLTLTLAPTPTPTPTPTPPLTPTHPQATDTLTSKPEDGAYCYGWFVEGANWDNDDMYLVESNPKEVSLWVNGWVWVWVGG